MEGSKSYVTATYDIIDIDKLYCFIRCDDNLGDEFRYILKMAWKIYMSL